MPEAPGTAIQKTHNEFTLMFVVDDQPVSFTGRLSPSIQPFSTRVATLTYNDLDDLKSTRSFNGKIGPMTFELNFDNGTSAKGDLHAPGVQSAEMVSGSGQWQQM
ncbi:uncharacterized protein FIESC28_11168 [Fusarium coffeatum]|uniref:Uncharacterized protein n=1 Tax=Fusarium coffeatum TaxID=231269 RepID=A0A366QMQ3_9HYPO|nr:uncharacterized protein FIESC28_11168 [Fusarium coffeatum]RBR06153.1 hypothetical protein FIESC28_11168 [Fusarium coffeatum]